LNSNEFQVCHNSSKEFLDKIPPTLEVLSWRTNDFLTKKLAGTPSFPAPTPTKKAQQNKESAVPGGIVWWNSDAAAT
jgi:hypothetical protein